jgi:thioredoxin-related protein
MSFEEAVALCDKNPKKIFIDVYTDWCGWCKRMDATTFKDTGVANYMNTHFYAVKLDAETKDTIRFRDKAFAFLPEYKANEIAVSLLSGQLSYPTFVYLDQNYSLIKAVPGYQNIEQLLGTLRYMSEEDYRNTPWEEFEKVLYGK